MSEEDFARSEQQERLELDGEPEPDGLDSPAWSRENPDAESAERAAVQLEPVEGDGPPRDTEPDAVGAAARDESAAGPEQEALHVEEERG
ncbi:hypothetical protein [Amycolatopsis australiensis]|uniref:DUF5709 domain-containing protein n=1 Tax=Amycolatopsis australiensis TaxID=546364 RepID=A0A1K1S462_9PSEU|nr:hypothetical protein [Amycolatopsis australiensis]SFW79139.1 hypothetical protein SAMN04489730_4660 [Amycolatopsis australiensis]